VKQARLIREYRRQLDGLGVEWRLVSRRGVDVVRFSVTVEVPGRSRTYSGALDVDGDLPGALRHLVRSADAFVRDAEKDLKP